MKRVKQKKANSKILLMSYHFSMKRGFVGGTMRQVGIRATVGHPFLLRKPKACVSMYFP
jgi:hypothetical protein